MFLNGSLENFSVADILQLLSFSKQTGALHVTGEIGGVLYLDDGEAYFATKESPWSLEDTVDAAGIPREDWNAALESAGETHAAGHALTERGVAPDLIGYVVHHIVSDTTFELMRMPRAGGSFDFRVGDKHAVGPVYKLRVDELVAEVRERLAEWDAISEFISSPFDLVFVPSELAGDSVELSVSREQWALLVTTIRNDRATVSELARVTGRSEAEVTSALDPLISSGLMGVEAHAEAAVAEPRGPEMNVSLPPPPEELSWWADDPPEDETTLSWEPLESQPEGLPSDQPEGLPMDQPELEIIEPVGDSEDWFPAVLEEAPEETALGSDPETADMPDTSGPLFDLDPIEETGESDPDIEAAGVEAAAWELEGAGRDLEERQPPQDTEEPPLSPAGTIDVEPPEGESAGFRTLALQELRDLAGTAGVQPATGPRQTSSKKPAETSDDKPPAQPKVRALKRLIAAVRGL